MNAPRIVLKGQIDGELEGFDEEFLFKLTNGTYWVQDEYKYWYYYAYMPRIQLVSANNRLYLQVVGQTESVAVREIHDVIESQINDEFLGWEGESRYQLVNGQVWEQARYKYEYKYAYRPGVLIFDAGGQHTMQVAGTSAHVRRVS